MKASVKCTLEHLYNGNWSTGNRQIEDIRVHMYIGTQLRYTSTLVQWKCLSPHLAFAEPGCHLVPVSGVIAITGVSRCHNWCLSLPQLVSLPLLVSLPKLVSLPVSGVIATTGVCRCHTLSVSYRPWCHCHHRCHCHCATIILIIMIMIMMMMISGKQLSWQAHLLNHHLMTIKMMMMI